MHYPTAKPVPLSSEGMPGNSEKYLGVKNDPLEDCSLSKLDSAKKRIFLDAFRVAGNFSAAALAADLSRQAVYNSLRNDADFKKAFSEVQNARLDDLEARVYQLGMESKSNTLDRLAYLRAFRPQVWHPDRQVIVTHNVNVAVDRLSTDASQYLEVEETKE